MGKNIIEMNMRNGDIHLVLGALFLLQTNAVLVPEAMFSLLDNKGTVRLIENPNKESLDLTGIDPLARNKCKVPIDFCGAHYPPDFVVSIRNHVLPDSVVDAILNPLLTGKAIEIFEP